MLITIDHRLRLDFGAPLPRLLLHLLLTPRTGPGQTVLDWAIGLTGGGREVPLVDGFGNQVTFVSLANVAGPVDIVVSGRVETIAGNGVLGWPVGEPVPWIFQRITPATRVAPTVWSKFRAEASMAHSQLGAMHGLMERIHELYSAAADPAGEQNQAQAQSGSGAIQSQSQGGDSPAPRGAREHAETFVGAARALGVPARLVTGYLAPDADDLLSGTHHWAEACVEGLGWIGFDCLLKLCPTDRHIRVAVGLDAPSAAAVRAYPPLPGEANPVETVKIDMDVGARQ